MKLLPRRIRFLLIVWALVNLGQVWSLAAVGTIAPSNTNFFDPLGFAKNGLMTFPGDPTGFKHLQEAETKHGRFAMMASTGSLTP